MDFSELLDEYTGKVGINHLEGESGVRNLEYIAEAIGYRQGIMEMLVDNPGMIEVMVEWLRGQDVPEWSERLADTLKQMDEQEEGEAESILMSMIKTSG